MTAEAQKPARFAKPAFAGLTYAQYYRTTHAVDVMPKPACIACGIDPQTGMMSQKGRFKGLCWVCRRLLATVLLKEAAKEAERKTSGAEPD